MPVEIEERLYYEQNLYYYLYYSILYSIITLPILGVCYPQIEDIPILKMGVMYPQNGDMPDLMRRW